MRRALIAALIAVALAACGGAPARAPAPPPSPAAELAATLEGDLEALAELAHRHAADCGALVGALRPQVDRMKVHAAEVERMLADPARARELRQALAGYAERAPARADRIAKDLGAAYLGCREVEVRYRLERAIAELPTFD